MGLRLGPVSVSSRGRVGAHIGPFSAYGGGGGSGGGLGALFAILLAIGAVVFVVMWPLSLWGHAIGLTPSWHQLMHRDHVWMHEHYALVGLRYGAAAALLLLTLAALAMAWFWLADRADSAVGDGARGGAFGHGPSEFVPLPPPNVTMPSRFTQKWIAENVPYLNGPALNAVVAEMRARGWSDADVDARLGPYVSE